MWKKSTYSNLSTIELGEESQFRRMDFLSTSLPSVIAMSFETVSLPALLVAAIIIIYSSLRRRTHPDRRTAPEATGAWPIIGHLHLLGGSEPAQVILGAMADKFGPVFRIRLGQRPALVVSSWEVAKECFTTNDFAVSSRPPFLAAKHLCYNFAMPGFSRYGPYWREMRKFMTLELLSNRRVELLKPVREHEIDTALRSLYKVWEDKSNGSGRIMVDLGQWFKKLNLNVILTTVVGKHYSYDAEEGEEEEQSRFQEAIRDFFYLLGQFVVGDVIPFLRWFDLGGHEKSMKKAAKDLDLILESWLEEHKRNKISDKSSKKQDFMSVLIAALDDKDTRPYDADTVTKATVLSMIAGGSETLANTLTWAISLLLNHPTKLRLAVEELDAKVGRERVVTETDISELVYLQAIVRETMRLYPPGPLLAPREFMEDCKIGGFHVAKGTRLITNVYKIQTDPRVWNDPFEFKPERFLGAHRDVDVWGKNYELIPFGSGRRACPGISFSLQTILPTLARVLQLFDLENTSDEGVDMRGIFGLNYSKATPLNVYIKPRLSPELV